MTAFPSTAGVRGPRHWRGFRALFAAFVNREAAKYRHAEATLEHEALRRRDQDAWRKVFETEHSAIYRYAIGRLGSPTDAEDATSQVFAEAWEHAPTYEDHGLPVRAWLFGIARNVVNSHRRRLIQRPPQLSLEDHDRADHDPALDADRLDLAKAVATLELSWAEVVTLRFIHGLSVAETASALGLSVDAVKGKQARALAQLRKSLAS
ncbi:MAG: sigma-70 family RNA polymerase sigma factor [bacterium]